MNKCSNMETRDFILQKTFGLLLQKGYNGVSVSDIQQTTGMARGLLYHYFGNQDKLFEEATEKYLNVWMKEEKGLLKDKTITELIAYLVEKYHQISLEIQENWGERLSFIDFKLLFHETARQNKSFSYIYDSIINERTAIWKTAVLNSFSRSELRNGINLESISRHFTYIEDCILISPISERLNSDIVYALEKGLFEFFEIIRR